jgi:uncharacterized protein (TIGR02284 family)
MEQQVPPTDTDTTSAAETVLTDISDAMGGYKTMIDEGEGGLIPVARGLYEMHQSHASALASAIDSSGGNPDDPGSFMETVHKSVATVRDFFGKLDASAIPQIVEGERNILDSYDKALEDARTGGALHEVLKQQRAELATEIDRLSKS